MYQVFWAYKYKIHLYPVKLISGRKVGKEISYAESTQEMWSKCTQKFSYRLCRDFSHRRLCIFFQGFILSQNWQQIEQHKLYQKVGYIRSKWTNNKDNTETVFPCLKSTNPCWSVELLGLILGSKESPESLRVAMAIGVETAGGEVLAGLNAYLCRGLSAPKEWEWIT